MKKIIIDSQKNPNAAVIWLHGLGADGHDFVSIIPHLHLSNELAIRFIFPHAPHRPITLNGGYEQRAWFDISSLDRSGFNSDEAGILNSLALTTQLIEEQIKAGIQSDKIILAGFSQGGSVALLTGLRYQKPLAGLIGLSTYLDLDTPLCAPSLCPNQTTPILLMHGTQDPVLPLQLGRQTYEGLQARLHKTILKEYPMAHSVCAEQLKDIGRWIRKVLIAQGVIRLRRETD